MKAYVIYVKGHKKSEQYMKKCIASCGGTGFEAEPFEGVTPKTLPKYKELLHKDLHRGRVTHFKNQNEKKYQIKKSCFTNHVRLWKKCIELNEPIAVLEQDVHCVWNWDNTLFDELLILNIDSAYKQPVFSHLNLNTNFSFGVQDYNGPLAYYHSSVFKGAFMMPGTGSYAVTPKGAKKLLKALDKYGWEQSDYFINTMNVNIQYKIPEYFTFKLTNLNMSHGF